MKRLAWSVVLLGVLWAGCGGEDAPADGSNNAGQDNNQNNQNNQSNNQNNQGEPDAAPDAAPDVAPDVAHDAQPDVKEDPTTDVAPDVAPDAHEDVAHDADAPEKDVADEDVADVGQPDADLPPDEPVSPLVPERLAVRWRNTEPDDRVTFGKTFVFDLEDPGIELPQDWSQEQYWSRRFPARMFEIEPDGERNEIPVVQRWMPANPRKRFRPQLQVAPLPYGWPKAAALELQVTLGPDEVMTIPFRTLPLQFDSYIERSITIPVQDPNCSTCWPYEVDAFIYFPPGYVDPDHPDFNNPAVHLPDRPGGDPAGGNPNQKYPVTVLLHTAGDYAGNRSLANSAGLRVAWGLMEPTIFILPNGRLEGADCTREGLQSQNCHTRFVGMWRNDDKIFSYRDFLADHLRPWVADNVAKIRGTDAQGLVEDPEIFRRSWSLYGLSAGGYGVLINAFGRPDAWYSTVSVVPGVVSAYNPYIEWGQGLRSQGSVCPAPGNTEYPLERVGLGFRDLSGVDPATDRRRVVHFRERAIPPNAHNCYQAIPETQHELVRAGLCQLDIACAVDPEAPAYLSNMRRVRDEFPYHGNIYFDTAIFDRGGPPGAFIDLDEVLDRAGIPHTFRYEDRGALFHNWLAVSDRGLGAEFIDNGGALPRLRGNAPGPGIVYPFLSRSMEGVGNPEFNSPVFSEYTSNVLDPDRDGHIYFNDPERPDLADFSDNCPQKFNPRQFDKDGDRVGDECDDDIDGDGLTNDRDPCNLPDLPENPWDPNSPLLRSSCQGDADGDSVPDDYDLCPETFDSEQRDTDNDNLGDACDYDSDNDFIPDDGDGDGLPGTHPCRTAQADNCDDNCPIDGNPDQADYDGNGNGDICEPSCLLWPTGDLDKDGAACSMDCNDGDPSIHPGADEVAGDGLDNDCDGEVDEAP